MEDTSETKEPQRHMTTSMDAERWRTSTETQEDGNGGAVDIQDNRDDRQGRRWIQEAENRGSEDLGQKGQQ